MAGELEPVGQAGERVVTGAMAEGVSLLGQPLVEGGVLPGQQQQAHEQGHEQGDDHDGERGVDLASGPRRDHHGTESDGDDEVGEPEGGGVGELGTHVAERRRREPPRGQGHEHQRHGPRADEGGGPQRPPRGGEQPPVEVAVAQQHRGQGQGERTGTVARGDPAGQAESHRGQREVDEHPHRPQARPRGLHPHAGHRPQPQQHEQAAAEQPAVDRHQAPVPHPAPHPREERQPGAAQAQRADARGDVERVRRGPLPVAEADVGHGRQREPRGQQQPGPAFGARAAGQGRSRRHAGRAQGEHREQGERAGRPGVRARPQRGDQGGQPGHHDEHGEPATGHGVVEHARGHPRRPPAHGTRGRRRGHAVVVHRGLASTSQRRS